MRPCMKPCIEPCIYAISIARSTVKWEVSVLQGRAIGKEGDIDKSS